MIYPCCFLPWPEIGCLRIKQKSGELLIVVITGKGVHSTYFREKCPKY